MRWSVGLYCVRVCVLDRWRVYSCPRHYSLPVWQEGDVARATHKEARMGWWRHPVTSLSSQRRR